MLEITAPLVGDALQNSVVYEEFKGDFALARKQADSALDLARQAGDQGRIAEALLALGIVRMLQGEPGAGLACFEEITQTAPNNAALQFRAASYSNLAVYLNFNLFPNGSAAAGSEIEARWSAAAHAAAEAPRRQELAQLVSDPALWLEQALVAQLLTNMLSARSFVDAQNMASFTQEQRMQYLATALQVVSGFRGFAASRGAAPHLIAYADLVAGDILRRAGQYADAQQAIGSADAIYRQAGDAAGVGVCRMAWGDWLSAPLSSPNIWNEMLQNTGFNEQQPALAVPGLVSAAEQNLDQVRRAYAEAEQWFKTARAERGLAAVQLRYAYLAAQAGDYAAAAQHASAAVQGFETAGDLFGLQTARAHLALCAVGSGNTTEEALRWASEIGYWGANQGSFSYALGLGVFLTTVGRRWLMLGGDYERSLSCYRLAEALFRALNAQDNLAESLTGQGRVYQLIGERASALDLYEQAWGTYATPDEQLNVNNQLVKANNAFMLATNMYQIYLGERDPDGMDRSVRRLETLADRLATSDDTNVSGVGLQMLSASIKPTVDQAQVLIPLYRGQRAVDAGEPEEAKGHFDEALDAARSRQDVFMEAVTLGQQRNYSEAAVVYRLYRAQGPAQGDPGGMLADLIAKSFGDAGQAQLQLQKQRTLEEDLSFYVRVRSYEDAKASLDTLEQIAGPDWWQRNERPWESLSDCGEVYEGLGHLSEALGYYDRGITELEARRLSLSRDEMKTALASGSSVKYLYFFATRVAIKLYESVQKSSDQAEAQRYLNLAFGYAERGKARALLDLVATNSVLAKDAPGESGNVFRWRQLNAQLATWRGLLATERANQILNANQVEYYRQEITRNETQLRQVEAQLLVTDPRFHKAISVQAQVASLDDVRLALPKAGALLQYYFLGDDLLAWAITEEGTQVYRAGLDTRVLSRRIRTFHGACSSQGPIEALGAQLAEALLDPFLTVIDNSQHLIIVPFGAAHALPFHALPWHNQPLLTTHTISYLPSASILTYLKDQPDTTGGKRADSILAIGDPANMAYSPPLGGAPIRQDSLPAARAEAAVVAHLFDPHGLALVGVQATEEAVLRRIPGYRLLHFATHGVLSEDAPLLSSILLANGEAITVYELMGTRLDADLVVLSACRTALGKTTGGDDVLGLTRGLLAAGARSALVTLWAVNDVSTSLLMVEFYRRLRVGESPQTALQGAQNYLRTLNPAERAVAQAQIWEAVQDPETTTEASTQEGQPQATREALGGSKQMSITDYTHPYYWAPFILVG